MREVATTASLISLWRNAILIYRLRCVVYNCKWLML